MAKLRVYELAKELGVDSKKVMVALAEVGEFVRSASSTVEAVAAQAVRDRLRRQPGGEKLPAPDRRPVRPLAATTAQLAWPTPREAQHRVRPRRTVAVKDLPALERVIAEHRYDAARIPEDAVELVRAVARAWASEWFTPQEAARWLALRMSPANARQCRELGITPELIHLPFQMPGRPLAGGTLTYLTAFFRGLVTIPEIRDDLARLGRLPPTGSVGSTAS
jgi:translation initiation factor IF-2